MSNVVETQPSAQSSFQKLNVDNSCQKTRKIRYYTFEVLSNFTVFIYFVLNILSRIVVHDPFLENWNWAYFWINGLKFYTVCFFIFQVASY